MKLSERMKQGRPDTPDAESTFGSAGSTEPKPASASDPVNALKRRAQEALLERMGPELWDPNTSESQLDAQVVRELGAVLREEKIPLNDAERDQLVAEIIEQAMGYGPIQRFLDDPTVSEVMVNTTDGVYIERAGRLELTDAQFFSEQHVLRVIDRIVAPVGRRIDEASPMVDARLPDGSRVNAVIPPLAIDGPQLTIRKFTRRVLTLDNLEDLGTLTPPVAQFLSACVRGRMNILISGGTGSGKTTLLNVLSSMIPATERIVTIEDAAELRLQQHHVIRLESRPSNIEGKGEVRTRELVRNALRMRPDRIVVGEVRGAEALDMLQAMNTGHDGSLSTLHANSPRDALARVETMVLMAGFDLPVRAIREQAASAIDVLVHIERSRDGVRRVTQVTTVDGMEGDMVTLSDVFVFDGELRATGVRPKLAERLQDAGITLPSDLFGSAV
ncbi:MAG TPA: CpaF family protein [Acidimicrobiia bacterium]|jgi:pilus assembly protein CpaF